jgi:cell fate regulator YaaT (PSP1 superfamily)
MYSVIGIEFSNSNRIYFFDPNGIEVSKNDKIIVETERGLQLGIVKKEKQELSSEKIVLPLKPILRKANKEDISKYEKNIKIEKEAIEKATTISNELELDMRFISANLTLEKTQLTLNFIADERVDFRELAKKLANIYKTRIELRQIGVRDKAKEIGGLGPCGMFLCCNTFLNDFNSVSINMAKNQYLSLNPTKINGICGRLLCCLKYEDDVYLEMKKDYPPVGTIIKKNGIEGKVISHNLFKKTYTVEKKDKTLEEVELN